MVNLTVTIDPDLLRRARIRALEEGTSVNAKVRDFLQGYVGTSPAEAALADLLAQAMRSQAGSGPGGRGWERDEVHQRG